MIKQMGKIKCELCDKYFKGLAGHLKCKHGITTSDYKIKFPNSLTLPKSKYIEIELNKIRKCKLCNSEFHFGNNSRKKFCSDKCRYESTTLRKIGKRRSDNYKMRKCLNCGESKEVLSYTDLNYFCDRKCYNNHHKVDKIEFKCGYKDCDEILLKSEKSTNKYCSRECYKKDYNEQKELWDSKNVYKKGYYISIRDSGKYWFDSSHELTRMKQLDMDDSVMEWKRNDIKVKYIGEDGKQHFYTPDFLVTYDNYKQVEEIKGWFTKKDLLKMESAIPFLKEMGIGYKILQKSDIYDDYVEPIIETYSNKFGEFQRISMLYTFMKMTKNISLRSTCLRRKVGCLVLPENLMNIYSIGYNGSVSTEENGCKRIKSGKCGCIHAETNALSKLEKINMDENSILLCTLAPCLKCSKEIIKYPISKVIYIDSYRDTYGIKYLRKNNIEVIKYVDLVKQNTEEKYV